MLVREVIVQTSAKNLVGYRIRIAGGAVVIERLLVGHERVGVGAGNPLQVELIHRIRDPVGRQHVPAKWSSAIVPGPRRIWRDGERIVDYILRIDSEHRGEVASAGGRRRNRVNPGCIGSDAKLAIPTIVGEKEKLVLAVDQFRDIDWPTQRQIDALAEAGRHYRLRGQTGGLGGVADCIGVRDISVISLALEKVRGIQAVVPIQPSAGPVQVIRAVARHDGDSNPRGVSESGVEVGCLNTHLLNHFGNGRGGEAPACTAVSGTVNRPFVPSNCDQ